MPPKRFNDSPAESKPPTPEPWKFDPISWAHSDCTVAECEEGFIHAEDADRYTKLYGCPRCKRHFNQIPSAKEWDGPVTDRGQDEMADRLRDRKELTINRTNRMARAKEIVGGLAKMFESNGGYCRKHYEETEGANV